MPVTFYRTLVDLVKSWKTLTTRELVKFAGEIEARLGRLEGQSADVDATLAALRQVALDRINLVLTPAIEKVFQIQERGFLIAHSSSSNTLGEGNILTFDIEDEAERELFTPSPFLALTREDNAEDVGIARLVSYSQQHGELIVEVVSFFGAAGPHTDWVIAATAGPTVAQLQALEQTVDARDLARDWAEKEPGQDVDGVGTRSAKHYALACAAQLSAMQELYDDIGAAAILVAGGAPVTSVAGEVGVISAAALKLALAIEIADITDFASHTHTIANVTNLQTSLDAKAPLASPALSGNPTAPTQSAGNNTTRLATTAFVQAAIAALVNSSPSALDTLNELAAALGNDANFATTMTNALAGKVATTRTIGVGGLATGGGDLSANRTITVPKASEAEGAAGTDDAKAMTSLSSKASVLSHGGLQYIGEWTYSTAVASVDFTDLGDYRELAFVLVGVNHATSGTLRLTLSYNNGASFGDQVFQTASISSASGGLARVLDFNTARRAAATIHVGNGIGAAGRASTASAANAVRFSFNSGNFGAGTIIAFGRKG